MKARHRRVMTLPDEADRLTTRYDNGVLEVAINLPGAGRGPTPLHR